MAVAEAMPALEASNFSFDPPLKVLKYLQGNPCTTTEHQMCASRVKAVCTSAAREREVRRSACSQQLTARPAADGKDVRMLDEDTR